jgi:hypothetical protein
MGSLTFITDIKDGETDILKAVKKGELTFYSDSGVILTVNAPEKGWTHDLLVQLYSQIKFVTPVDAKVSDVWIGSTEI